MKSMKCDMTFICSIEPIAQTIVMKIILNNYYLFMFNDKEDKGGVLLHLDLNVDFISDKLFFPRG